jgi:hypothetical protein
VSYPSSDPRARFVDTVVLPADELALRRERKRLGHLSRAQLDRLMAAAALRDKTTDCERDD